MTHPRKSVPAVPPGGSVSSGGVKCPPAPPLLAEAWLLAWNQIGGAVTIGTDGSINPWFHPEIGCSDDDAATVLIAQLLDTPGLPAAVKVVLAMGVRSKRRPANRRRAA